MGSSTSPDANEQRALARVGQVLRGKWRLERLLGTGGMAAVYAATHRNGSRAAVKLLHAGGTVSRDNQRRFLREGYVANSIGHPGAVRVLDDDEAEDGAVFMVMELLEGESAEERRCRLGGQMPLDEALFVADGLLDVLAAAHPRGVLHRDIKPHNVFLTAGPTVKLLDFGIAKACDVAPGMTMATQTGAMLGTPAFMPPEQTLGHKDLDGRTDLWAVGATLFYLLSGRIVHQTVTLNELIIAAATIPAPSLATAAPSVPARIVTLVDRALAFDKASRFPDARAMQRALTEARVALGLPAIPPSLATIGSGPLSAPSFDPIAFGGTLAASSIHLPVHTWPNARRVTLALCAVAGAVLTITVLLALRSPVAPAPAAAQQPERAPSLAAPPPTPAATPSVASPSLAPTETPAAAPSASAVAPRAASSVHVRGKSPVDSNGKPPVDSNDWLDKQH